MTVVHIVVHTSENKKKCSVEPLRGKDGFRFYPFPLNQDVDFSNCFRLGIGGKNLSVSDALMGLVVLDGTWRHAGVMENIFPDLPVRSLSGWQTAYPRVSKLYEDPDTGLATIEAIFAAFVLTGRKTEGLLEHYFWKEKFLRLNQRFIVDNKEK
ncbi:MAG: DTW domain-containing protein [Proteobacteria bacterium]|nr:DTW domain-containing protein [Pseudomonadota bacterium]